MSDTSSIRIGNNNDYKDSASIYNEASFFYLHFLQAPFIKLYLQEKL